MLQPIIKQLNSKRIILASSSPRRRDMLTNIVSCLVVVVFLCRANNCDRYPNIFPRNSTIFIIIRNFWVHIKGLNVELCPSLFEENLEIDQFSTFADFVEETALQKVLEVSERLNGSGDRQRPDIIIGADTMVTLDNEMFGKPKTKENAIEILRK